MNRKDSWSAAFRDTAPVMAGYLVLGMGFGILLRTRGYGLGWALGMSVFIFAGAMQYVGIDLMASGASLLTAGVTTLLVNARHLFYGISMLDRYRSDGWRKPYIIFALTDETYSLVCTGEDKGPAYHFRVSLLDQIYWISGSVLGSLAGSWIKFNTAGIDFSLTALFLTVFVDQWRDREDHGPALVGLGATAACLVLFGPDSFLLPAMGAIVALLLLLDRRRERRCAV